MKRRAFITVLGGAVAWPVVGRAQSDRVRRVGVLMGYAETDPTAQAQVAALRQELQMLGWEEGRNIRVGNLKTAKTLGLAIPGRYDISSVRNFIRFLRQSGSGPAALSAARGKLATEKAELASLARREKQGLLVPVSEVATVYERTFAAVKSRALAMPSKIASRLAEAQNVVQAQAIVKAEVDEFLHDAELGEVRFGKNLPRRRLASVEAEPKKESPPGLQGRAC